MGGADWQCNPVPLPIGQPVRKRLCPGPPTAHVVIANLIPQTTALQLKIAVCKEQKCALFYFWLSQPSSILVTSYHESQTLKLTQHDAKKHNPQLTVQHGTQFTFRPRVLTVTAWRPDMVTDGRTVSDRWQANWQSSVQCHLNVIQVSFLLSTKGHSRGMGLSMFIFITATSTFSRIKGKYKSRELSGMEANYHRRDE